MKNFEEMINNAFKWAEVLGAEYMVDVNKSDLIESIEQIRSLHNKGVVDESCAKYLLLQVINCPRGIEDLGQFDHTYVIKQPQTYHDESPFEQVKYCFLRLAVDASEKHGGDVVAAAFKKSEKEFRKDNNKEA